MKTSALVTVTTNASTARRPRHCSQLPRDAPSDDRAPLPNRFCGVDHDAPDATAARGADVVTPSPDAPPPVLLRFDSTTPRVLRERFRAGRLDALPCACKLVRLLDSAGAPDGDKSTPHSS